MATLEPRQVLDVDVGHGLPKMLHQQMGISHTAVDLAADLSPDILAGIQMFLISLPNAAAHTLLLTLPVPGKLCPISDCPFLLCAT